MSRRLLVAFTISALVGAGTLTRAFAQKPVTQTEAVTMTAIIRAIDSTHRLVTLEGDDGTVDTIECGPAVQHFDALKVGDKVTFKYFESVVYAIQKPGDPPPTLDNARVTRTGSGKPGGTISRQMTTVVTVRAIDEKVPSVAITTSNGSKMSFKIEDKKNLEGVKVGDKVQITYTQALAIGVETPGAK